MKRLLTQLIDWFLYTVLSDQQRETIANLFSNRQKEFIKRFTQHGKRHQQKQKINHIKNHLYSLGQRKAALADLTNIVKTTNDNYLRRLAAFELILWYVNDLSEEGAKKALTYIEPALDNERDPDQRRRILILEIESLARIGDINKAKEKLNSFMQKVKHPDLYLAMANLQTDIQDKLTWINRTYEHFHVNPITFTTMKDPTYDQLTMAKNDPKINKTPKVSIIIPCYNAEIGVKTAIDSLLNQTWQNIELLLVDDHSTDNTLEVIQEYAQKDSRIKVFQTPKNSGPYIARNIALQAATGEFVTVNDADDWSHEKKIETQVQHLLENKHIVANTSAHARLTEDLHIYRRGTPGRYLFPNMSSIMFRRKPVLEKLGFFDEVRFAADGEFKRRLLRAFGEQSFVDLETAPLSLPRQTVSSLTGSSAFGYNGFFMGVRKEYVESLEHYHDQTNDYYYPHPQTTRPFPVPEPMWPNREKQRHFKQIILADFRKPAEYIIDQLQKSKNRLGLVPLYTYDLELSIDLSPKVRSLIDGDHIQMLVYGEKVTSDMITIIGYDLLLAEQPYVPQMTTSDVQIVLTDVPKNSFDQMEKHVRSIFPSVEKITWFPLHEKLRQQMSKEEQAFLAQENWVINHEKQ